jgi:hypothetical protein
MSISQDNALFDFYNKRYFEDLSYKEYAEKLEQRSFKWEGSGAFRHTYVRGNVVIKVPKNDHGVSDNRTEAYAYRKFKANETERGLYLAPCRLLSNDCLMMVRVQIDDETFKYAPQWVSYIEGSQAGVYKGRWVAYDYAYDV